MNINMPSVPTFAANKNIRSFQDAKRHQAARDVIDAVMNGAGRARYLAENDNRGVYDDFPAQGIAGKLPWGTHNDSVEFVRFNTNTGEIQEFGREETVSGGHDTVQVQFNFEKLDRGFKFMRAINGKATSVVLSPGGNLVDITNEWVEGF